MSDMSGAKILIVEDEAIESMYIQHNLTRLGYPKPVAAYSGEEGVRKAEEIHPDLILMDIMMPGKMDGIAAAEEIRSRFDIPIIFLTAYADEETLRRAKVTGPHGYIVKPFQERELHITIDMALAKHRLERELLASEERFRNLFQNIVSGVSVYEAVDDGRDFVFKDFNAAGERIEQISRDRVIGRCVTEVFPGVGEFGLLDVFRRVWKTGKAENYPVSQYKDKRISGWRENHVYRLPSGEIVSVFDDVTARKQSEETLLESVLLLRRSQEIAHLGSWELDLERMRLTWSDEVYRIFGLAPHEFGATYEAFLERVHPDDRRKVDDAYSASLRKNRETYEIEHRVVHKGTGEVRTVKEKCFHIRDAAGRIVRSIGMVHDITEHKRIEEEHLQFIKAESLNRMAGAIAHNFNNMLAVIIGNLGLALSYIPEGSEPREFIMEAMGASERAATISRLMLTYLGQSVGSVGPIDVSKTIRETCPLLTAALPAGVRMNVTLPPSLPIIKGNAVQLTQALSNLITNAVEAIGEEEGEITLTTAVIPAGDIMDILYIKDSMFFPYGWKPTGAEYVRLSIADTGRGIDPENLDKIFDPFFSTKFSGRGLGLSIIPGLLKGFEGAISVENQPGRGATFKLFFPVSNSL